MEKWQGKVAVVTGASSGIGASIAKSLAKAGVITIGLARRTNKIEELKSELGIFDRNLFSYECDVTSFECVKKTFKSINENHGGVQILINNAGVGMSKMLLHIDENNDDIIDDIHRIINTNINGFLYCTREAFRIMSKSQNDAIIININSICGHEVPYFGPDFPPPTNIYAGTKYSMTATNEVIRQELNFMKKSHIRISSVSPASVQTGFAKAAGFGDVKIPNALEPDDISDTILFILKTPLRVNIKEIIIKTSDKGV